MDTYCYADVIERLFREFDGVLPLPVIVKVTNVCRHQLSGSPAAARPELLERLARQRLHDISPAAPEPRRPLLIP